MQKSNSYILGFEIDKLTDSILNRISGDSFRTEISLVTKSDLKTVVKSKGWSFDWKYEFNQSDREVYKLTIIDNPNVVQGLISLTVKTDHVYMFLLESAPFNIGKNKLYEGVSGNLVAFACKVSFNNGYDGYLAFDAKTVLVKHYQETLYATHFKGTKMMIETPAANRLISKYFKK